MRPEYFFSAAGDAPAWVAIMPLLLTVLVVWSLIWKGLALWRAGRKNQLAWFIVMLIVNTCGILEIIYLLTAGKNKTETTSSAGIPDKQ